MTIDSPIESVAVIGEGASGLAALHSLTAENCFGKIRLFERKNDVGGLWIYDREPEELPPIDTNISEPLPIPKVIPGLYPTKGYPLGYRSAVYDHLETNVPEPLMSFSYSKFDERRTKSSIKFYGEDHPFRHHSVVKEYLQKEFMKFSSLVEYGTAVEKVEKRDQKWILTLRIINKDNRQVDYWYEEDFSAVIVANGHYSVPKIPKVPGLANAQKKNSELIQHASSFRNTEGYENKTILIIGTGTSATDIVSQMLGVSRTPIYVSCRGEPGKIFSKTLANNTKVEIKPGISEIKVLKDSTKVMAQFTDESTICVDKIILATGYLYDFPFFRKQEVIVNENNRVEGLYQHIFKIGDPSLSFIGIVVASISFRIFEYQATLIASVLSRRTKLHTAEEQKEWELDRLAAVGDLRAFHVIPPDYRSYYECLLELIGPYKGMGHKLEPYGEDWEAHLASATQLKYKYWSQS